MLKNKILVVQLQYLKQERKQDIFAELTKLLDGNKY